MWVLELGRTLCPVLWPEVHWPHSWAGCIWCMQPPWASPPSWCLHWNSSFIFDSTTYHPASSGELRHNLHYPVTLSTSIPIKPAPCVWCQALLQVWDSAWPPWALIAVAFKNLCDRSRQQISLSGHFGAEFFGGCLLRHSKLKFKKMGLYIIVPSNLPLVKPCPQGMVSTVPVPSLFAHSCLVCYWGHVPFLIKPYFLHLSAPASLPRSG